MNQAHTWNLAIANCYQAGLVFTANSQWRYRASKDVPHKYAKDSAAKSFVRDRSVRCLKHEEREKA